MEKCSKSAQRVPIFRLGVGGRLLIGGQAYMGETRVSWGVPIPHILNSLVAMRPKSQLYPMSPHACLIYYSDISTSETDTYLINHLY